MNILLIYPEIPVTFWSFKYALKFIHNRALTPPLGLLTVAGMLGDEFDLRLVDLNVEKLRKKDIDWADYAFISAMQIQELSTRKILDICNKAGLKVVAGGPLFTHEYKRFDSIDHFLLNEAELVLPDFLADLKNGCAKKLYKSDNFADMPASPIPRYDLIKMKHYAAIGLQYSRGCPFDCEFCDVTTLFGRRPRVKSVQQTISELDRLIELGWNGRVFFVDDNLIGNRKDFKHNLLPALIDWQEQNGPITFFTQTSINVADDPEMLEQMARAGFDMVFIGIETPDMELLADYNKKQNINRDMLKDIHRIQSMGIQVDGGFILGFDNESPSIFQRQVDFIKSSGILVAMVGLLQATTGTKLHNRLKKENRLISQASGNNVTNKTNFKTTMPAHTLQQGYAYVLKNLYSTKAYYQRLRFFLKGFKAPQVTLKIDGWQIWAFLASIFKLGIIGRERMQYWSLLFWTLTHKPKLLATAVTMAIMGHHFRRVCQAYFKCNSNFKENVM